MLILKYTVVNMVAAASLDQMLDLYSLAVGIQNIEYEPEQFPGAILRLDDPKLTFLLFKNGKMICAGAKKETHLKKGLKIVEQMVLAKTSAKKEPKEKKSKKKK